MKCFLLTILHITHVAIAQAQQSDNSNSFGWSIILEGTRYKTIMPEGVSFYHGQKKGNKIDVDDFKNYRIGIGEPILVIDNFKGGVIGFDPMGRTLFIENKNTLFAVTEYQYLTTGVVVEDINLLDGTVYQKGRYMLIVEQSFNKNTYSVMVGENKKVEVPMNKIGLVRNVFSQYVDQVPTQRVGH